MLPQTRRIHAFTLIELLVVVAIIAVLAAMLLPVLGKSREQSRRTICRVNLHTMALSLALYADDNDGNYPSGVRGPYAGVTEGVTNMVLARNYRALNKYASDERVWNCPNWSERFGSDKPIYQSQYDSYRFAGAYLGGHALPTVGSNWASPQSTRDGGTLEIFVDNSYVSNTFGSVATHTNSGLNSTTVGNIPPSALGLRGTNAATTDGAVVWRDVKDLVKHNVYYAIGTPSSTFYSSAVTIYMYW